MENVRFFGRNYFDETQNAWFFNFTCAGFEVLFEGTALYADLLATGSDSSIARPYLSVFLDEQENWQDAKVIALDKPSALYSLVENLPYGRHKLRVLKRSDIGCSAIGIQNIHIENGQLLPLLENNRRYRMEFIGDSITCGFGNVCPTSNGIFMTSEEDGYHTFASLTAEYFKAQYHIFAVSGWGIYASKYGKDFPSVYEQISPFHNTDPWDFEQFTPDVVVIHMGTNDDSWVENQEIRCKQFIIAYKNFLKRLRGYYPNADIICADHMLSKVSILNGRISQLISSLRAGGDMHYHFMDFRGTNDTDGVGAGHPSIVTHEKNAQTLIQFVSEITGW